MLLPVSTQAAPNDTSAAPPKMPPHIAIALLDRLCTDDVFRAQFVRQPTQACRQIGLAWNGDAYMPDCLRVSSLASKAELQQARDALVNYLSTHSTSMTVVLTFEARQIHRVIR